MLIVLVIYLVMPLWNHRLFLMDWKDICTESTPMFKWRADRIELSVLSNIAPAISLLCIGLSSHHNAIQLWAKLKKNILFFRYQSIQISAYRSVGWWQQTSFYRNSCIQICNNSRHSVELWQWPILVQTYWPLWLWW